MFVWEMFKCSLRKDVYDDLHKNALKSRLSMLLPSKTS
jgi:hypothetical protein